jgi:hypothetical protein
MTPSTAAESSRSIVGTSGSQVVVRGATIALNAFLRRHAVALAVFVLASILTGPHYGGDTNTFAKDVIEFSQGRLHDFWDVGHLLWRPLGYVLFRMVPSLPEWLPGSDAARQVVYLLVGVNWIAGLGAALLMHSVLLRFAKRRVADAAICAFVFGNAFLNYYRTGNAYVPGLFCLTAALYFLAVPDERSGSTVRMWIGGTFAGLSICFWLVYLWSVPAVLLLPLVLFGPSKQRFRGLLQSCVACGLVVAAALGSVMVYLAIGSLAGFRAWVSASSHGIDGINGLSRMGFGFARSVIDMGSDGSVFKRFLLHDPISPVPLSELIRSSLWKLGLFYGTLGFAAVVLLRRAKSRPFAVLLCLAGLPVLGFGVFWQGGDLERYLPLYPILVLALAVAANQVAPRPVLSFALALLVAVTVVTNTVAFSRKALARKNEQPARQAKLLTELIRPESRLVVEPHNALRAYKNDAFFDSAAEKLDFYPVVEIGNRNSYLWRSDFAALALDTWQRGGDVWLVKCLRTSVPGPCKWVEGDDAHVGWSDFDRFFSQLDTGNSIGGDDGFVQLIRTETSARLLTRTLMSGQIAH